MIHPCRSGLSPLAVIFYTLFTFAAMVCAGTYSGGTGDPNDPFRIATAEDLITLGQTPDDYGKCFILLADIDMSSQGPNTDGSFPRSIIAPDTEDGDSNFQGTPFSGLLNGNGFKIYNLNINSQGTDRHYLGFIGNLGAGATVKNLGLENISVIGGENSSRLGGLCGTNFSTIIDCFATGTIIGGHSSYNIGGLCGESYGGTIFQCYANVNVTMGGTMIGGLCGDNGGTIRSCCAMGSITGTKYLGGLCGIGGMISDCYAIGQVNGLGGGLFSEFEWMVRNCYAIGSVAQGGGFNVRSRENPIVACFWDIQTSGQIFSSGGLGLTTLAMQNPETYLQAGWDFKGEIINGKEDVWVMPVGGGYPVLAWQLEDFPIANDDMDQSFEVSIGSVVEGTTIGASGLDLTRNGYNDCIDVWYSVICAEQDEYTIAVQGINFDTTLGIFDEAQREIAFNDDFFGKKSVVILKAKPEKRYYIRVAGQDGQTGNFRLSISQEAVQSIQGDLNYDGKVDFTDLSLMARNWLK